MSWVSPRCPPRSSPHPSPLYFVPQQMDLYVLHHLGFLSFHWVGPVGGNGRRLKDNRLICSPSYIHCELLIGRVSLPLPMTIAPVHQLKVSCHCLLLPLRLRVARASRFTIFCLLLALSTALEIVLLLNSSWLLYVMCHLFPTRNLSDVLLILFKLSISDNLWRQNPPYAKKCIHT